MPPCRYELSPAPRRHGMPEMITMHGSGAHGAAIRRDDEEHGTPIEASHARDFSICVNYDHRAVTRLVPRTQDLFTSSHYTCGRVLKAPPGTTAATGAAAIGTAATGAVATRAHASRAHATGTSPIGALASRPAVVPRSAATKPRAVPGDRKLHVVVPTRETIIDGLAQLVLCRCS
jgi:hypothetical protein